MYLYCLHCSIVGYSASRTYVTTYVTWHCRLHKSSQAQFILQSLCWRNMQINSSDFTHTPTAFVCQGIAGRTNLQARTHGHSLNENLSKYKCFYNCTFVFQGTLALHGQKGQSSSTKSDLPFNNWSFADWTATRKKSRSFTEETDNESTTSAIHILAGATTFSAMLTREHH